MTNAIGVACNYRMMKLVTGGNEYYGVYEVYYDDYDRVLGFSEKPYTAAYENNPMQTMEANLQTIIQACKLTDILGFNTDTELMWEETTDGKVLRKVSYLRKDVV